MSSGKLRADAAEWRPPSSFHPPGAPGGEMPVMESLPPNTNAEFHQQQNNIATTTTGFVGSSAGSTPSFGPTAPMYPAAAETQNYSWQQYPEAGEVDPNAAYYEGEEGEGEMLGAEETGLVQSNDPEDWAKWQQQQIQRQLEDQQKRAEWKVAKEKEREALKAEALKDAPTTSKGNKRFPKKPKSQVKKQREQIDAENKAFEAFSNAVLHSVSPFMSPLRQLTGTSLPHIKVDQRYGKRGQPQTAVSQFIIAPVVVNYRPTHFHEVTPGDLMEFHFDLSLVLKALSTSSSLAFSFGSEWKPFAIPYCFLSCRDYRGEVLKLCPNEIPNGRAEVCFEDDIVKDVSTVVLAVPELAALQHMSFAEAMQKRVNLTPLYHVFNTLFKSIGNYQIQVRNLNMVPSAYLLKTSERVIAGISKPVVVAGAPWLWETLPNLANSFQSSGKVMVADPTATATTTTTTTSQDSNTTGDANVKKKDAYVNNVSSSKSNPPSAAAQTNSNIHKGEASSSSSRSKGGRRRKDHFQRNLLLSGACMVLTGVAVFLIIRRGTQQKK